MFIAVEHINRWERCRNTQTSTDDTSNEVFISEHEFWVQENFNNKVCVYGFGSEGVNIKRPSRRSSSAYSSSVNNYDA